MVMASVTTESITVARTRTSLKLAAMPLLIGCSGAMSAAAHLTIQETAVHAEEAERWMTETPQGDVQRVESMGSRCIRWGDSVFFSRTSRRRIECWRDPGPEHFLGM